ncbi:MAG: peptidylprolyl isomerase [Lewinellaceae bacterium]|nr:peptidylprolyl isomerase [Saprospiraceae bacterium]MCB9316888.1 peptidylprolyl isomerase [Lewinellaceae bacterium]MCB9331604.1 peptidylprolyl isomerase [Lewinellaceae bacterium]
MALIGTIRKNGWILIVSMTLALGGFILMDIVTNAQRYSAGDVNSMGVVNGQQIKRDEFDNYEKLIYTNTQGNTYQIRQQIWNYFVEKALVENEAEELGLGVSKEELIDLEFGNNLSPVIAERFKGQDGQPNRATLSSIKAAIDQGSFTDPVNVAYWSVQEKEVKKARLQEKITNMVVKGIYTPTWQAEMTFRENNERIDFNYVRIPYDKIPESDVKVTDADYEAYLELNPHLYDQEEETRLISYATFDVLPTAADSAATKVAVGRMLEGLREAPNDSAYVVSNNGNVDNAFRKKDALPAIIADSMMNLPIGSIVGPYEDQGAWQIAKIMGRKVIPDSVKARHILLRDASPANEQRIDSLMALLNAGTVSFDTLAIQNSADQGSAVKGGDLGYFGEGAMVPEFNAVCFYEAEQGKYYKVATQFGWHLIQVTGKKFIKNEVGARVAYLGQRIEPSTETQQTVKDKALAIVQQAKTLTALQDQAGKLNIPVQTSPALKASDFSLGSLGTGEDAREVVRWAFDKDTKVDAVGQEVFSFRDPSGGYFDSKYVVAALKSIVPKGPATVASLKANPTADQAVKNRKKAAIIKEKLKNAKDLNALASQWETQVDTAKAVSILQAYVPNGGAEPAVVGTAFSLEQGAVSAPVAGVAGVYVLQRTSGKPELNMPPDLTLFRRQVTSAATSSIRMNLLNTWRTQVELEDHRSRFF